MADYKFYFKKYVKTAYVGEGSREEALTFLEQYKFGIVKDADGNEYKSKKELKNAKSIKPKHRTGSDNAYLGGGPVSEDTDRELSGTSSDRTE